MVTKPRAFNQMVQPSVVDAHEEVDAFGYLNDWKYKLLLTLTPPVLCSRVANIVRQVVTWEDYD